LGVAGYFKKGIKYIVNHIIPANMRDFFTVLFPGREFLDKAKTIPKRAPTEVPKITPARIYPLFCQVRYPSYFTQN